MALFSRRVFFLIPLFFSLTCCTFFRSERIVTVTIPALPEPAQRRFGSVDFLLMFPAADKRERGLETCIVRGAQAPDEGKQNARKVEIRLPKKPYVPCLAYPLTDVGSLKPAGGVTDTAGRSAAINGTARRCFARSAEPSRLYLTWEDGFAAEVLLQLFTETKTYEGINIPRFLEEIEKEAELENGGGVDPWKLDKLPILLGFGYGSFSVHRIKKLETFALQIPLAAGTWFWDNPLKSVFKAPGGSEVLLEKLPLGRHILICADGNEYVSLHIGRREWYAVYPVRGEYKSGNW